MKKFLIVTASSSILLLSGCAGNMGMNMKDMEMMKGHMAEMQRQMNTVEASAATAKDMASEAMTKASQNRMHMMKMGHMKNMMK